MKAIIIDPERKSLGEVDQDWDIDSLQAFIGGYIENGSVVSGVSIYVDEEGLLKNINHFFRLPELTSDWLAGRAVILGYNELGEATDCPLSFDEVKDFVFFASRNEILASYVKERGAK